jgi:hypothetical protein
MPEFERMNYVVPLQRPTIAVILGGILCGLAVLAPQSIVAQSLRCDPAKVNTAETCAKCHGAEVARWQQTPHFKSFESLARNPRAREITSNLGLNSIKRNDLCINCHFTLRTEEDGQTRPIAGVSCESCHGASRDWLPIHNDYGGPNATKQSESPQHRVQRLQKSTELGMNNTQNVYLIARNCFDCHTVPHEQLVNIGGHLATSESFELVAWSQGLVRHNFLRTGGVENAQTSPQRLRLMYVTGLLTDLEYSTRAVGLATEKSTYGLTVAQRAANVATKLYEIQQQLKHPLVQESLQAFAEAELAINNSPQLNAIADRIGQAAFKFAQQAESENLSAVDPWLPTPDQYR